MKKALETDTRENIYTWYSNYAKASWLSCKRPNTIIKDWVYKEYIKLKEKPNRLNKLESILEYTIPRSHPTEIDSYGERKQFFGLLPEEEDEYDNLCIAYYWEKVRTTSSFRWI